ncbi:MAG TPA: 3-oxoadipate enol-lactonase [Microvirga sp.]|jgi:3-oxoadipate enol-lactonase/4-carboxymuconolactone decarboxylase
MPLIQANGTTLFYDITGPDGAPVVAFSNSLGTTLEMWDAQVRALAPRYRCLRYDTRGHGRSPVAEGPFTVDSLADDLVGLLDALGIDRPHVVGLSLGGMTAQAFAVRYPQRLASLTLVATAAHLPPPEGWDQRAQLVRAEGMGAIVDAVMSRWFTPDTVALAPDAVRPVRERFLAMDPRGYAGCCLAIRDMDLRTQIGAISVPTLVVAGEDDPATPLEMSEEIASRIPGASLVVVPEAAHLVAVEQPDALNDLLLAFLSSTAGERRPASGGISFEAGLANRKSVLGVEHVQRSLEKAGAFAGPWQDFITRNAWGEIWGDPTLPWKTRSLVTLAIMVALHREEEFKLHVRPALKNGVTVEELRALLMQTAIYAGVPAANAGFRWVREVLGEELDTLDA